MRTISLSHSIPILFVLLATQSKSVAELPQPPTPLATPIIGEVRTLRIGSLQSREKAWDGTPNPTHPPSPTPAPTIGSLSPTSTPTPTPPTPTTPSVLYPPYAKDDNGNWPNVYSPLTIQASWTDWLYRSFENRGTDYANRGVWLHGAGLSVVGNPVSGNDGAHKTRSLDQVNPDEAIIYNGALGSAVLREGAPNEKTRLRATGSMHLTATTFSMRKTGDDKWDNANAREEGKAPENLSTAWNAGSAAFRGIEDYIGISRELAPLRSESDGGAPTERLNARETTTREDDVWDISPAVIKNMVGSINVVHLDGGVVNEVNSLASVDIAAGVRAGVVTREVDGRTAAEPLGMKTRLILSKIPAFIQSPDRNCRESANSPTFGTNETDDATALADWAGLEIESPNVPEGVEIGATTGVWVDDLSPGQAGGSPIQVAAVMGSNAPQVQALSVEQDASLIARGDTLFDSSPNTVNNKYSTLYINDLLHLEPRDSPPIFDSTVRSERAGAIYFDASLNRLCVSIPIDTSSPQLDATDPAVVWMPLAIEPEGTPSNTATSYVRPRIDIDFEATGCSVGIQMSHFSTSGADFYWRRPGYGYDKLGRTQWDVLPGNPQTSTPALFAADLFMSTGPDGIDPKTLPNVVVHVMAIDKGTGEVAGLAFDRWPDGGKRDAHATVKDLLLGRVASSANLGSFPALVGGDNRSDAADLKRCAPEPPPPPESLELTPPPPSYTENETSY